MGMDTANNLHITGINEVKVIQVIKAQSTVGQGTEKDPVRIVTSYWDLCGNLITVKKPDIADKT